MKTYSRLTLAFLLLILIVPPVGADEPPKDGPHVEYWGKGKKQSEGHWKNGGWDGPVTEWDEDGKKILEIHYKNGRRVSHKVF